jgi:hypothetical protein
LLDQSAYSASKAASEVVPCWLLPIRITLICFEGVLVGELAAADAVAMKINAAIAATTAVMRTGNFTAASFVYRLNIY